MIDANKKKNANFQKKKKERKKRGMPHATVEKKNQNKTKEKRYVKRKINTT